VSLLCYWENRFNTDVYFTTMLNIELGSLILVIGSLGTAVTAAIVSYFLNQKWNRKLEKDKKKYEIKLERYETIINTLESMSYNLEELKLLFEFDWSNEENYPFCVNVLLGMMSDTLEEEREIGGNTIKTHAKSYNELIKRLGDYSTDNFDEWKKWVSSTVYNIIMLRSRYITHLQSKLNKSLVSLRIIDAEPEVLKQVEKLYGMHTLELLKEILRSYRDESKGHNQLYSFIEKFDKELEKLIKLMKIDLEQTL